MQDIEASVNVRCMGDPTTGIWGNEVDVPLGIYYHVLNDALRESTRDALRKTYFDLWDEVPSVTFNDEWDEFGYPTSD